jgi:hypothetical protein
MARLQTRIVLLCLLTAFASSVFAQPENVSLKSSCDATMQEAKKWLAAFNPTAPNADQLFQERKQRFDQWVDYCSKWATGWTVPFTFELPKQSSTPQQITAGSTLRLREERPIFTLPATLENNTKQYVKVTCYSDTTRPASRTTDPIHPLVRVPSGDTITVLKPADCSDSSGMYTQIRTQQGIVGYMQITRAIYEPVSATAQSAPQQTAQTPATSAKDNPTAHPKPQQSTAQPTAPPQQPTPTLPAMLSSIFAATFYPLLGFLCTAYIVSHLIFAKRIAGHIPKDGIGNSIIEAIVFSLIAAVIALILPAYLKPVILICFGICLMLRIDSRLEPLRQQKAAADLKEKQETLKELAPLLDTMHRTFGKYAGTADFIPASWYAPRRHYFEYMARLLYTSHKATNSYYLTQYNVTPNAHPLWIVRYLPFSTSDTTAQQFADPNHPYNVLIRAITDPSNRDHSVFQKLIPANADLLPYLTEKRWQPALAAEAEHLAGLVEQELLNQKCTIIGRRTNPEPHPYPLYYRDSRFRHSYLIGKTGSGKSTLLRNLIAQDIHYGHGLIVLSPENDLFEKLLTFIPEERKDNLIYFDPTDIKPPIIGFNPLALEDGTADPERRVCPPAVP